MKKITFLLLLIATSSFSQILEPVKWSTSIEKISDSEYNLVFTANIDEEWHLYSQYVPENGPLPTVFKFKSSPNYSIIGNTSEEKGDTVYEETFEMKITFFKVKAIFKQRVKITNQKGFKILGEIEYMSCNNSSCVPGYDDFKIEI
jgi:hypothetical protein